MQAVLPCQSRCSLIASQRCLTIKDSDIVISALLFTFLAIPTNQGANLLKSALGVKRTLSLQLDQFRWPRGFTVPSRLSGAIVSDDGKFVFSGNRSPVRFQVGNRTGKEVQLARVLEGGQSKLPQPLLSLSPLPNGAVRHGSVPGPGGVEIANCFGSPDGWRIWLDIVGAPAQDGGRLVALAEVDFRKLGPQHQALSSRMISTGYTTEMPFGLVRDQASDRLVVMWDHAGRQEVGLVDSNGNLSRFPHEVSGIRRQMVVGFDNKTGRLYQRAFGEMKIAYVDLKTGKWHVFLSIPSKTHSSEPPRFISGGRFLANWPDGRGLLLIESSGATKRFQNLQVSGASANGKVVLIGGPSLSDPASLLFLR
jgi:hypothetical protein